MRLGLDCPIALLFLPVHFDSPEDEQWEEKQQGPSTIAEEGAIPPIHWGSKGRRREKRGEKEGEKGGEKEGEKGGKEGRNEGGGCGLDYELLTREQAQESCPGAMRSLPVLAAKGPSARAKAPSDRKIPITLPFSSPSPNRDTMVVRLGTMVPAPVGRGGEGRGVSVV